MLGFAFNNCVLFPVLFPGHGLDTPLFGGLSFRQNWGLQYRRRMLPKRDSMSPIIRAISENDTCTSASCFAYSRSNMRQCLPSGRVQRHHITPLGESAQQYASAPA